MIRVTEQRGSRVCNTIRVTEGQRGGNSIRVRGAERQHSADDCDEWRHPSLPCACMGASDPLPAPCMSTSDPFPRPPPPMQERKRDLVGAVFQRTRPVDGHQLRIDNVKLVMYAAVRSRGGGAEARPCTQCTGAGGAVPRQGHALSAQEQGGRCRGKAMHSVRRSRGGGAEARPCTQLPAHCPSSSGPNGREAQRSLFNSTIQPQWSALSDARQHVAHDVGSVHDRLGAGRKLHWVLHQSSC